MGFKREPILVFEDLMNEHLFGDRHIINPHTNNPLILNDSLFAHIYNVKEKLVTVADIYFRAICKRGW